jgi:hypothetical protein
MKNVTGNEKRGRARKVLGTLFLAGGLFGVQANAAIPAPSASIPARVAAVRAELHKRVSVDTKAASKLPYAHFEVASWLNWVNWPNWNDWRNWNNWANWNNWTNWINF